MIIWHNNRCRKSRETLQLMEGKTTDFEIVNYLETPPSKAELKEVIAMLGIKPHDLIRKGEAEYKDNFKGKDLSDDQWLDAMVKYPKLIERPIVIKGNQAIIGRPPEKVLELL
ncbi:MAG: arsenate reductase (glutaredoxin) [Crocinitomicaceae bacterium]|nr:arsenate reductase (glutaredoxin) [Crocinitomicaceae bacterium]